MIFKERARKRVGEMSLKNRRVNLIIGVDGMFPIAWNSKKKWAKNGKKWKKSGIFWKVKIETFGGKSGGGARARIVRAR